MKPVYVLCFALFVLLGCENRSDMNASVEPEMAFDPAEEMVAAPATEPARNAGLTLKTAHFQQQVQEKTDDKIIKTANLRMQVDDLAQARQQIGALLLEHDGYVASEEETNARYQIENRMVLRVPNDRFDALTQGVLDLALAINQKHISARDVTEEFVDMQARLKTKRAVAERFESILLQARNITEILAVENELRKVREEIESTEGRLNYLSDQATYSTINLAFYETRSAPPAPGRGFFARMGRAFVSGWTGLQDLLIELIGIWPHLLLALGIGYLFERWWKRRKKAQVSVVQKSPSGEGA